MSQLQLRRLRIEQLRQYQKPFEIACFEPGLNIFTGPNEAGKSSIVRAIRAAFFERHRSTAVDDLKPWGDSAASPSIELDFVFGGQTFQLSKSFLSRKRCNLSVGAQAYEGVEAEDYLAELFGFGFAGKGASKEEHWGVPGLLWVQQGEGQALDVSHARDHLHTALSQQTAGALPSLASSRGDELLAQLKAQRAEWLTPSSGKPRAAFAEAIESTRTLSLELAELDQRIAQYRTQVDDLARLQQEQLSDESSKPWEVLSHQLKAAQTQQLAIEQLKQQLDEAESALTQLLATRQLLQDRLAAFEQQEASVTSRAQRLQGARQQQASAADALQACRNQLDQARQRETQARSALGAARLAAQHQDCCRQLEQAQRQLATSSTDLARALAAEADIAQVRAQAPSRRISQADLERLSQLDFSLKQASLRKETVATRITWKLLPGQRVELSTSGHTQEVQGDAQILVDSPLSVRLPGLGEMRIEPGGEELDSLLRAHQIAQQAWTQALALLGVSSLEQARQEAQALVLHEQQLERVQNALDLYAPAGVSRLQDRKERDQENVQQLSATRQSLAPAVAGSASDLPSAETENRLAETSLKQAEAAWQAHQIAHTKGQTQLEHAEQEWQAARQLLEAEGRAEQLTLAQQALADSQLQQARLQQRMQQTRQDLASANPGFVAQDIERLEKSLQQLTSQLQQRRERILLLQNTLQVSGAQGLEEQRATLAGELERSERRRAELERRAQALTLLCSKLEAKREQSLMRLQQPLLERMQHYLALLFPGARLEVNDDLSPSTLLRPRASGMLESGTVQALSFGSREQIGLICRFAYADLLAQANRPTLLILDDALVHSDDARLAQMKRIIYDVSQRHQVLVFTCHPNAWRDLGVGMQAVGAV
jgi:hypothetical protein